MLSLYRGEGREKSDEKKIYLGRWMVNFLCVVIVTSVMVCFRMMMMNVHPEIFVFEELKYLEKGLSAH